MTQKIFGLDPESPNIDHDNMLNISGGSVSGGYYHLTQFNYNNVNEQLRISSSRGGGLSRKSIIGSVTLSAGSIININVPATSRIVCIQLIVDELITSGDGATSWSASLSGGSSEQICSEMSFTKNTTVHSLLTSTVLSETDIQITPDTGTFSGGIITAVCYYEVFENLTTI